MAEPTLLDLTILVTEQTSVLKDVLQRVICLEKIVTNLKCASSDSAKKISSISSKIPVSIEGLNEPAIVKLPVCATNKSEVDGDGATPRPSPPPLPDPIPSPRAVVNQFKNDDTVLTLGAILCEEPPVIRKRTKKYAKKNQNADEVNAAVPPSTPSAPRIASAPLLADTMQHPFTSAVTAGPSPVTEVKIQQPSLLSTSAVPDAPTPTEVTVTSGVIYLRTRSLPNRSEYTKITRRAPVTVKPIVRFRDELE